MAKLSENPVVSFLKIFFGAAFLWLAIQLINEGHDVGATIFYLLGLALVFPGAITSIVKIVSFAGFSLFYFLAYAALVRIPEIGGARDFGFFAWLEDNWMVPLIGTLAAIFVRFIFGPEPRMEE